MKARPLDPGILTPKDITRFLKYVDMSKGDNGCWPWTAAGRDRYGRFYLHGEYHNANRVAFLIFHRIPLGALDQVCHTCDFPPCMRPDHLFKGTKSENMKDMSQKGRGNWITKPWTVNRGEKNGWSKLSETNVREILRRRASGERQVDLAKAFNVTQAAISLIVLGRNWGHVKP